MGTCLATAIIGKHQQEEQQGKGIDAQHKTIELYRYNTLEGKTQKANASNLVSEQL